MFLSILLILKFILFTYLIHIQFNRVAVIIISSLISILILSIIYRPNSKRKNTKALVFYTIVSIIMLADATYYSHFNSLPNILALKQLGQLGVVTDSIRYLLNIKVLSLVIDIPFIIYIMKKIDYRYNINNNLKRKLPIIVSIILIISIFTIYMIGKLPSVKAQEIYTYHITDIKNTILGKNKTTNLVKELDKEDIKDLKERTRLKEGNYTGIGKERNLIVLQIEALQNFVIDLEHNGKEVTPNLNKLVNNNSTLYYNDYHQLLGRGNTSDAEFVSNNSLYPSMEEPTYTQYEKNRFYGLPWLLKDNGYTSWVFHGYEKEFWNRRAAYPNQGFDRFLSEEDYEFTKTIGFGIRDEDFYKQTIDYMKELDNIDNNPFYAFIISLTSHTPFNMPEEYQYLDIEEKYQGKMIGDYLQSIHYADKEIGKLIEMLKEEDFYNNSVIAIYGDHFAIAIPHKEEDLMGDLLNKKYDFDEMMKIPLIIHIPGENLGQTISKTGSQLDFYPTIANIMGYDNKKGLVFGRDLNNYRGDNYIGSQTYMLKGSFISRDILFEMSRDGVYEHSRGINRETREEIDIEKVKGISDKVKEEINKSNYILETDYFKEMEDSE